MTVRGRMRAIGFAAWVGWCALVTWQPILLPVGVLASIGFVCWLELWSD